MQQQRSSSDVAIIGAGFFGCELALELNRIGVDRIALSSANPASCNAPRNLAV